VHSNVRTLFGTPEKKYRDGVIHNNDYSKRQQSDNEFNFSIHPDNLSKIKDPIKLMMFRKNLRSAGL